MATVVKAAQAPRALSLSRRFLRAPTKLIDECAGEPEQWQTLFAHLAVEIPAGDADAWKDWAEQLHDTCCRVLGRRPWQVDWAEPARLQDLHPGHPLVTLMRLLHCEIHWALEYAQSVVRGQFAIISPFTDGLVSVVELIRELVTADAATHGLDNLPTTDTAEDKELRADLLGRAMTANVAMRGQLAAGIGYLLPTAAPHRAYPDGDDSVPRLCVAALAGQLVRQQYQLTVADDGVLSVGPTLAVYTEAPERRLDLVGTSPAVYAHRADEPPELPAVTDRRVVLERRLRETEAQLAASRGNVPNSTPEILSQPYTLPHLLRNSAPAVSLTPPALSVPPPAVSANLRAPVTNTPICADIEHTRRVEAEFLGIGQPGFQPRGLSGLGPPQVNTAGNLRMPVFPEFEGEMGEAAINWIAAVKRYWQFAMQDCQGREVTFTLARLKGNAATWYASELAPVYGEDGARCPAQVFADGISCQIYYTSSTDACCRGN